MGTYTGDMIILAALGVSEPERKAVERQEEEEMPWEAARVAQSRV